MNQISQPIQAVINLTNHRFDKPKNYTLYLRDKALITGTFKEVSEFHLKHPEPNTDQFQFKANF